MLNGSERQLLDVICQRMLVTKGELKALVQEPQNGGLEGAIRKLKELGYIEHIESMGTCIVPTQRGIRAVRDNGG